MDVFAIIALVTKGLTIAQALIDAGKSAAPAINALLEAVGGKKVPTTEELDRCEVVLDALIDEFNLELPAE